MNKVKSKFTAFLDRPYLSWAVISFIIYFIVETVNQKTIIGAVLFIVTHPVAFILNLAIVMVSFSSALFIRKRLFNYTLISLLWILVSVINMILLVQRNTQFNASDVLIFRYGIFITARYLSILHCIIIAVGLAAATIFMVYLYRNGYKTYCKPSLKKSGIVLLSTCALIVVLILIGNTTGILMPRFTNIKEGYTKNGFVYAFGCSIFESGIDEPEDFSNDSVTSILEKLPKQDYTSEERPNVVFVQLESFIDPSDIRGMEFNEDPVPNFNKLIEEYPSGRLTVPVLGGGTANTEFEILTGMSLKYFGTIEYPYETYADNSTCESMAYNYKALGYNAHAIHNFSAGFYMRNKVFENLGFDTFTSFEYMTDLEYNDIGWAKDIALERYIMSALESDDKRDFIYTISVQGHGSYPNDFDDTETNISTNISNSDIEEYRESLYYYISQVKEMDDFVGDLVNRLADFDEPTVVVFYGDHLPGISFTEGMLQTDSLYLTEYVIWSNYDIKAGDKDVTTYQLAAHVQDILGLSSGTITKFHQTFSNDEMYQNHLQTLEYDIIEGDMLTYGGKNPFVASEIKYGVEDVAIKDIEVKENELYVIGENFNEHSSVYINGSRKSTEYVDSSTLMVDFVPEDGDKIEVAQMNYQLPWSYLSKCEEYIYNK